MWSARLNTSKVTENRLEDLNTEYIGASDSALMQRNALQMFALLLLSFQSVRSYEEIRGAFDSKVRLQSPVSTTVNGDCSTSHWRRRPVHESGRRRSKRWSTSQHLDDGWSRLKTEVYYEVVCALSCLHSLACKA